MALPPTWALAVSEVVRYHALRPWQPRLALNGAAEPLPKRVERLRTAWASSRLADGKRTAEFNVAIFEAAIHRSGLKRLPDDPVLDALLGLSHFANKTLFVRSVVY